MAKRKDNAMQNEYIERMVKNLPVLRAAIDITQMQLGEKVGVSRQTIVAIENRKSPLNWTLYLAMVCVFQQYEEPKKFLESFKIFDKGFIKRFQGGE